MIEASIIRMDLEKQQDFLWKLANFRLRYAFLLSTKPVSDFDITCLSAILIL